MLRARRLVVLTALSAAAALTACTRAGDGMPGFDPRINGHAVQLDEHGKLIPRSHAAAPYADVARRAWGALQQVPVQPNGYKTYLAYSRFDPVTFEGVPWPHNPAGFYAMLAESASSYYAYSGDHDVIAVAQEALDHQLAHGTTPLDWDWSGVPFSSGEPGSIDYTGADDGWCDACGRGDGVGVLEPDKVGELGLAYLKFYEATGDETYKRAAIACADALAKHVREGDASNSPWPFRVYAKTNEEREAYSSNVIGPISLFDELARLGEDGTTHVAAEGEDQEPHVVGDPDAYGRARKLAWDWLMAYPIANDAWSGYFEDINTFTDPGDNPNQYVALQTARYLIEHTEYDPDWEAHATHILGWTAETFGGDANDQQGEQYGAVVLSEQRADMAKMGSHTARFAAVNALFAERTGDDEARERAYRSFNWATYMCSESGVVTVSEDHNEGWWFSDGYGDYIRHFMVGLGAMPEWAPPRENHLLRSTSIVRDVTYEDDRVSYVTFDSIAHEVLRVRSRPTAVTASGERLAQSVRPDDDEGYTIQALDSGGYVLRVNRLRGADVTIELEPVPPDAIAAQTPAPSAPVQARPAALQGCQSVNGGSTGGAGTFAFGLGLAALAAGRRGRVASAARARAKPVTSS